MKQYYTDKKYKELLSYMVVLVDIRENTNKNVIDWFDRNNIKWKSRALKTGDYGLMVESCLSKKIIISYEEFTEDFVEATTENI